MRGLLILWTSLSVLSACVGPAPVEDYALAWAAIQAAKKAEAQKVAPGYYAKAEELYRQALAEYEQRKYNDAQETFRRARQFAERAENYSVIKKVESGEL